ncbi:MAG: hypothetical protein HY663_01840 [Chloroflexi bacterium]|nr:hypothetical protein [Chloroflexota bacterium]
MAKAVVVLGAGASADFGVPILSGIFKDQCARRYLDKNPWLLQKLNTTFWEPRGHSLDLSDKSLSIEQMLTVLADLSQEKGIPDKAKPQEVDKFKRKLKVLIQKAIFDGKSSRGEHLNPLISLCRDKVEHTTWASFNWDCIFESSFWYSRPYGNRANPKLTIDVIDWHGHSPKHTYLKLHGGINWWDIDGKITYVQWTGNGTLTEKWKEYDESPKPNQRPVILEPSFYKYRDDAYKQLSPQWDRFL